MTEQQKENIKSFLKSKGYIKIFFTPYDKNVVEKIYYPTFIVVDGNKIEQIKNGDLTESEKDEFNDFKNSYFAQANTEDTYQGMLEDYCSTMCHYKDGNLYITDDNDGYVCYKKSEIDNFINSNSITL